MIRTAVTSSNLKSVGYDAETQTLEVEFKTGGIYSYASVSPGLYERFTHASSLGSFLHTDIKPHCPVTRLSSDSPE